MVTWKRDFASGLIVLVPVIVTLWVVIWLYNFIAAAPFLAVIDEDLLATVGLAWATDFVRVLLTLIVFGLLVLGIGYLMRTAIGNVVESWLDGIMNRLPGLRVIYNASKMAAETALTGTESLQTPVKVELWGDVRLTAFKTGKRTRDGRELLFMPTAPNITTGFVIEVEPEDIIETDERVEEALTRLLSAGFGDNGNSEGRIASVSVAHSGIEEDSSSDVPAESGSTEGTTGNRRGDDRTGSST